MQTVYLSLGSNIGNKTETIQKAIQAIELKAGTVIKQSSLYTTQPWGNTAQPTFINQVLLIETIMNADDLLNQLLQIEEQLGRKRTEEKWMERIIDIDILFYNNEIIHLKNLTIPHPFIQERKFVLIPMMEIAKDFVHPVFNTTIEKLVEECTDKLEVMIC